MEALIVSGGHLDEEFAVSHMRQYSFDMTIAVDSGMGFFYRQNRMPHYIVGDFDSVKPEILESFRNRTETDASESFQELQLQSTEYADFEKQPEQRQKKPVILQFQPEKDETDTEIAIRTAISQGCDTIHILGATGTRVDHMMGNIHLLGMAMEQGVSCLLLDKYNRIRMINRGLVLKKEEQYGNYVSLLPFTPQVTGLTLTGFKYPLNGYTMECYHSLGVSNEITAEQAEISFQDGVLLVVESRD